MTTRDLTAEARAPMRAGLMAISIAAAAYAAAPADMSSAGRCERTRSIGLCIALHSAANTVWNGYWSI